MKRMLKYIIISSLLGYHITSKSFTLHRVILATDAHENYIQFWPLVAKAWKEIVGLQPTLALIADSSVEIDTTCGDVIRFEPIEGVPTSLYAQCIRLLLPALFEDEGCILSDIDMIPLSRDYFIKSVASYPDTTYVVYRDKAYHTNAQQYPMCYCAAYGKVFKEIFSINAANNIPLVIKRWHSLGLGWSTDELIMYRYLTAWNKYTTHCIKLGHTVTNRIDRIRWAYNTTAIQTGKYIDAHCPRPYSQYKTTIDEIMNNLMHSTLQMAS